MKDKDAMQLNEPELFPPHQPEPGTGGTGVRKGVYLPLLPAAALLLVLVLSLLFSALYFVQVRSSAAKVSDLRQENELLRAKIDSFGAVIDSIYTKLDSLEVIFGSESGPGYPYYSGGAPADKASRIDPKLAARIKAMDSKLARIQVLMGGKVPFPLEAADPNAVHIPRGDGIPSIYPTFGSFSDGWGMRIHPFTNDLEFHTGLDIANRIGTPVYATADGVVRAVGYDDGYGKYVHLTHDEGFESQYAHLYNFRVRVGDKVGKGQIIGLMGSSGLSTGPHLHYGVTQNGEAVNPSLFLNRIDTDKFAGR
jgi:murein DD-endopeptidase MepM/ murein hydrolase activator NlpD